MSTTTKNKGFTAQISNPIAEGKTKPLKSGKNNAQSIILKITEAFKDRNRKDIQSWRIALASANDIRRPRFDRYFDLVDDLLTDGTLQTQIQLRKSATLSTGFQVRNTKTGEVNEQATELLRQKWFYRLLNIQLDAVLLGTRLVEFTQFQGNHLKFAVIPPRNTVPSQKIVFPDLRNESFISYDQPGYENWLLELNEEDPLGIINNIIPNLIWKRNVAQSWAEFCEKFGMPLVSATTNNNNTAHIDNVERQLLSLAEASVGVFPEGTTIKFDEANRTDAYNVYSKFIEQNSNEIAGTLVGSNTLSGEAGNRAQTEVHERSLDAKISQADRREISFTVNDSLFPLLQKQGYTFIENDDVFEWIESKEEIDLNEYWTIVSGIMQEYEVEQEWLSKTFNVPIVKKKPGPSYMNPFGFPGGGAADPDSKKKDSSISKWRRPDYPVSKIPTAVKNKKLDELTTKLLEYLWANEDHKSFGVQGTLITEEALHLVQGLKQGYGVTAAWNTPDTLALQLMEYNLFEFAASKTEARLAAMTDLLIDKEKQQIRSFADFKRLAEKEVGMFNEQWLQTEYNLSVAVGQTSAAYHRFMAEADDVTSYVQYQTAGDGNVRDSHAALDGEVFSLKDPEAMRLWPPNGYGCRCEMIQYIGNPKGKVLDGKTAQQIMNKDNARWATSQFSINRGDLKQVFTNKQFYHSNKGLPDKLNKMTFDRYDLPAYSEFKQDLNPLQIDTTITPENIKELFKTVGKEDFMRFRDYAGRKLMLSKDVFDQHIKGYYLNEKEQRHQLFPHIKDVLSNPDEVWFFKYKEQGSNFQNRYIKFYNNEVIVIDGSLNKNQELHVNTWYKMKDDEAMIRKGLKIK